MESPPHFNFSFSLFCILALHNSAVTARSTRILSHNYTRHQHGLFLIRQVSHTLSLACLALARWPETLPMTTRVEPQTPSRTTLSDLLRSLVYLNSLVGKALPAWYVFMSLFAIIEIGTSGYLVGKGDNGGDYGGSLRSAVRFALFTGCEKSFS